MDEEDFQILVEILKPTYVGLTHDEAWEILRAVFTGPKTKDVELKGLPITDEAVMIVRIIAGKKEECTKLLVSKDEIETLRKHGVNYELLRRIREMREMKLSYKEILELIYI